MLTLFLFFFGENGYVNIMDTKYRLFCALCGGYILIIGVIAVESLIVGTIKLRPPLSMLRASSWAQRLALIYIALTWASALVSPYFPETVLGASRYEGALTITIYGISFLLVSVYGKVSRGILWILGAAVLLFSAICLLQITGYNPLSLFPEGIGYADKYVAYPGAYLGTIGNVDLVAAFFCLTIPIMWVALLRLNGKLRFLLLIPLSVALVTLLSMDVLAGLVGVFVGGILSVPVVAPVSGKWKKIIWTAIVAVGIACIAVIFFVDIGTGFLHELHEILQGRPRGHYGSCRIHIWGEVLRAIPNNIMFGAGPDTMIRAGLRGLSTINADIGVIVKEEIDVAHSEYLNILFHQGVFALIAYLGLLALLAKKWLCNSSKDAVSAILGASACCYCIQALFGISMFITAPLFWLALGLLESRSSLKYTGGCKK